MTGPKQGGGSAPTIKYYHNTSYLLLGKVDKVETFDASGDLISRTESNYESVIAYEPATHRASTSRYKEWDYYDYYVSPYTDDDRPQLLDDSYSGIAIYNDNFRTWTQTRAALADQEFDTWITDGNEINPPELTCTNLPPEDCNCANYLNLSAEDQGLCEEYWSDYHQWISEQPETSIDYFIVSHPDIATTGGMYDTPDFYDSRNSEYIEEEGGLGGHPRYLYSFFIKKTQDTQTAFDQGCKGGSGSIQTITEYDYYDANYRGKEYGDGFGLILQHGDEDHLFYEPSWQLYKKKTSSPQLIDAYTEEEFFYLYDLVNNSEFHNDPDDDDHTIHSDDFLLWDLYHRKKLRTLPYETRVTSKAAGEEKIVRSTYFIYDNKWKETRSDYTETEIANPCGPDDCSSDPDDSGDPGDILSIVYTKNGHPCHLPNSAPDGYDCPHEDFPAYLCPCADEESTEPPPDGEEGGRSNDEDDIIDEHVIHRLEGKLYLAQVHTQVEEGTGAILTFEGNDLLPKFPYKHLKTNEILSRNLWGQVVREQNERGIVTHYDYGATHAYEFPACENGHEVIKRIYSKNTAGQPVAVTVGAGATQDDPDHPYALTTQYEYNLDHTIAKIIDPNGMELTYNYDQFKRMSQAYRNGEKIQSVRYSNWDNNLDLDFKNQGLLKLSDDHKLCR